ncbi:MAG: phytoene desaturase [Deltaproteobacteria bacterium]|nr:phytoene desaturase [Deltaproteobacteria bacterium]
MSSQKRVAVIGSGFGGLAAAIRLQSAGIQTTIYEKRDIPGGRAYVFKQDGFSFDAGPTVITAPDCLKDLFKLSGRNLEDYCELIPVTPLYKLFWEDGNTFDYTADIDETLRQIEKKSPGDAENYKKFLNYSKEVFDAGYTELAHVPFLNFWSMMRVAPELVKLQAHRSVYSMVSKFIKDKQLAQAFSFHSLLVGGNPFKTSSIYTLIHYLERKWGVYFAKGGTHALVMALVKLFEDLGGKIHCNAEVDEIVTQEGRIVGIKNKKGELTSYDMVVSNADVAHTYRELLKQTPELSSMRKKIEKMHYSMSLFLIYFGTNKQYPHLAHHNVLFGPRYKELLQDIFSNGVLPDDFSLYLHAPTRTDASLAPPGCENFYVLSPVGHLGKLDIDWKVEGPKYAEKILKYLDERYIPGLRRHLVTQRVFTPEDFKTELNAFHGSAFSLEPRLTQSAYFRTHNRDAKVQGLYFVGAGTHPGAGVPGVVGSAQATADLILQDVQEPIELRTGQKAVLEHCQRMIEVGSRSFSFASKLFDPAAKQAAFCLYGWCRFCDDEIDQAKSHQKERVERLYQQTQAAYEAKSDLPVEFRALSLIVNQYQIPSVYPLELIEGMRMDVEKTHYETVADLNLYCYRVAGVVGLMMCHIMGVSEQSALKNAADMGMAMQMTNIARDILEDFNMGRVYLPAQWLKEVELCATDVGDIKHRQAVAYLVRRLVKQAQSYYESGNRGLKYLSFRAALAVAVASCVYSAIGKKVVRRGELAWDTRTVVSGWEKIFCAVQGFGLVLMTLPYRLARPWKRSMINTLWRQSWSTPEIS